MRRLERIAILGLAVAVLACLGLIGTIIIGSHTANRNTANLTKLTARVANDEFDTCVIQRRGLPAGHELAASMSEIHALLTLPSPTPPPPPVAAILSSLNGHLATYLTIEAKQPRSRSCRRPVR